MEHLYKPNDYEAKIIIFYALKNLNKSPTYTILSEVVSSGADIQYFELQSYLQELVSMNSIEENKIGDETVYMLTSLGEDYYDFYKDEIMPSVQEKILEAAKRINNDKSEANKVYADYIPINENEYKVVCGIIENNVKLLDFEMYAGAKDKSKKICRYFKEHTNDFYMNIVSYLEDKIQ